MKIKLAPKSSNPGFVFKRTLLSASGEASKSPGTGFGEPATHTLQGVPFELSGQLRPHSVGLSDWNNQCYIKGLSMSLLTTSQGWRNERNVPPGFIYPTFNT